MKFKLFAALAGAALALTVQAQRVPTLEEAVNGRLIETEWGRAVRWMPDGERYSQVERRDDGLFEVAAYRAKDGAREVIIPAEQLMNPATGKQLRVRSFQLDEKGEQALI